MRSSLWETVERKGVVSPKALVSPLSRRGDGEKENEGLESYKKVTLEAKNMKSNTKLDETEER